MFHHVATLVLRVFSSFFCSFFLPLCLPGLFCSIGRSLSLSLFSFCVCFLFLRTNAFLMNSFDTLTSVEQLLLDTYLILFTYLILSLGCLHPFIFVFYKCSISKRFQRVPDAVWSMSTARAEAPESPTWP